MKIEIDLSDLPAGLQISLKLAAAAGGETVEEFLSRAAADIAAAFYPAANTKTGRPLQSWLQEYYYSRINTGGSGAIHQFLHSLLTEGTELRALEHAFLLQDSPTAQEEKEAREYIATAYSDWIRMWKPCNPVTLEDVIPVLQTIAAGAFTSREEINNYYKYLFNYQH